MVSLSLVGTQSTQHTPPKFFERPSRTLVGDWSPLKIRFILTDCIRFGSRGLALTGHPTVTLPILLPTSTSRCIRSTFCGSSLTILQDLHQSSVLSVENDLA